MFKKWKILITLVGLASVLTGLTLAHEVTDTEDAQQYRCWYLGYRDGGLSPGCGWWI